MSFYMRNYTSEEKFDISKFMNYTNGVFDMIASPFLTEITQLPTVNYYYVDEGYRDIDLIASDTYGDVFYAYLIQLYNGDFRDHFPEGTVLRLFSPSALNELYFMIETNQGLVNKGEK